MYSSEGNGAAQARYSSSEQCANEPFMTSAGWNSGRASQYLTQYMNGGRSSMGPESFANISSIGSAGVSASMAFN